MTISPRLYRLFLLSVILFAVHGIEEILTGFYMQDPFIQIIADQFQSIPQSVYYVFHIMWWLLLLICALLLRGGRWILWLMTAYGLAFPFETHHIFKAVEAGGYYPGLLSSMSIVILGVFFWRALIQEYRTSSTI